jgi:hypothetical protein
MTEAEWLTGTRPEPFARFLRTGRNVSDRKLRLIACGCCRLVWDALIHRHSREAVRVGELFADWLATADELGSAAWRAEAAVFALDGKLERHRREQKGLREGWLAEEDAVEEGFVTGWSGEPVSLDRARSAARAAEKVAGSPGSFLGEADRSLVSVPVIRDIVGNSFRPVTVDPRWLTSDVVALAGGIYDERAFDRLPILADALQDAGCDNADILDHCRDPHLTHVRGCWVVDLLLGKA